MSGVDPGPATFREAMRDAMAQPDPGREFAVTSAHAHEWEIQVDSEGHPSAISCSCGWTGVVRDQIDWDS